MFTLAVPGFFVATLVAAAVVVGLHLLARHERRAEPLPTARFVPNDMASSVVRIDRLRDLALLLLRIAALLLIGLATARPTWVRRTTETMRVILVDRGALASSNAAMDSVLALTREAQSSIIAFDSVPRIVTLAALGQEFRDPPASRAVDGAISAALVAGVREALALLPRYARVELHIVSPVTRGAGDAATLAIRRQWPDSLFVHRTSPADVGMSSPSVDLEIDVDDPIGAAARLALPLGNTSGIASVRMRRGLPSSADSAWGRTSGRVLVSWPARDSSSTPDTLAAVATTQGAMVGFFTRSRTPESGEAIAWWSDGEVAARELPNGDGCIRMVGFSPSAMGDGALSPGMQRMMRRLAARCGSDVDTSLLPSHELAALVAPPAGITPPAAVARRAAARSWLSVWLLVAGLLMLLAEWYLRARPENAPGLPVGGVR